MTPTRLEALQLNSAYVRLTGFPSTLTLNREYQWSQWQGHSDPPWTVEDLELVVGFIRRHMAGGKSPRGYTLNSLRFQNIIWDLENFESLIGVARAEARVKPVTAREMVLTSTGRPTQQPAKVKTAGDVLAGAAALAEFRAWRTENNL